MFSITKNRPSSRSFEAIRLTEAYHRLVGVPQEECHPLVRLHLELVEQLERHLRPGLVLVEPEHLELERQRQEYLQLVGRHLALFVALGYQSRQMAYLELHLCLERPAGRLVYRDRIIP